jgi:hypothetical protein
VFNRAYYHSLLMNESGRFVETAARSGAPQEQLIASRILDNPTSWIRWEHRHADLLRPVTEQHRPPAQSAALKLTCFSLIHRKALFEYLRDWNVRGRERKQLLGFFHRTIGYSAAVIAEHENYLASACSFMCTSHVGCAIIHDGAFQDPMRHYEELYAEYFRTYCEGYATTDEEAAAASRALLPYLKYQLAEQRQAVLDMPRVAPSALYDAALRQPTGDTVRLRVDPRRFAAVA